MGNDRIYHTICNMLFIFKKRKFGNFTSILILLFMILPYVNAQSGDGWRYGFTSSFNRIIFYLFFIIIYEFLIEISNEV